MSLVNEVQTITMIVSVVIAVVSLVVAITFNIKQQTHNKNSVRPIIDIIVGDYETNIFVKLVNHGVGPATITSLKCKYNGSIDISDDECNTLIDILLDTKAITHDIKAYTTFVEDISGRTVPPNDEIVLVKLETDSKSKNTAMRIMLKDISVSVEYKDIYNTKFDAERKLDFFGRLV